MIPDIDIYRSAQALIKMHGEDALFHADRRMLELMEDGDEEGTDTLRRIKAAIFELQTMRLKQVH